MIHGGGGERKAGNNRTIKPEKEASRWIFYIICWSKTKWCYSGKKKKRSLGFFFSPHPPFYTACRRFSSCAKSSDSRCGNARSYLCRRDGVWIGLGLFCTVKEQMSHTGASVQNWRGGVVHPITHPCENVRLHDSVNPMNKTSVSHSPPLPCCWSQRRYLRGSRGPGRVEDVERVVGGKRNAVVRPSCGHLFVPVQTQLRSHRHLLLKKTHRHTREHKLLLILKKLL